MKVNTLLALMNASNQSCTQAGKPHSTASMTDTILDPTNSFHQRHFKVVVHTIPRCNTTIPQHLFLQEHFLNLSPGRAGALVHHLVQFHIAHHTLIIAGNKYFNTLPNSTVKYHLQEDSSYSRRQFFYIFLSPIKNGQCQQLLRPQMHKKVG